MTEAYYKEEIDDILIDPSNSVIVIADSHLGAQGQHSSCPLFLHSFLKWLKKLEESEKPMSVDLGFWGNEKKKVLKPPQELILLGDILELWDATDRSIDFCSRPIFNLLGDLSCNKIYVLGNHDNDLIELIRREVDVANEEDDKFTYKYEKYPINKSDMLLTDGIYPTITNIGEKGENDGGDKDLVEKQQYLRTVRVGNQHYLFIHGHQFDRFFNILPQWKWMAKFRIAAMAFGTYTWVFVSLFFTHLLFTLLFQSYELWNLMLLALLTSISVPFFIIQFGRRVFNKIKTKKYDREGAMEGFIYYWESALANNYQNAWKYWEKKDSTKTSKFNQPVNVVYGHTHLSDFNRVITRLQNNSPDRGENDEETKISGDFNGYLINIPAWSKDLSTEELNLLQSVFLYIDDEGSLFIAWDSGREKPFLIPTDLIQMRREGEIVVKHVNENGKEVGIIDESKLQAIDWPKDLINKWKNKCKLAVIK